MIGEEMFGKLDQSTQIHSQNTQINAKRLARLAGLPKKEVLQIEIAAQYHDLGKTEVPVDILDKKGILNDEEFALIKKHPKWGYDLLHEWYPEEICRMVLYHHENEDGSGYFQLKGDEIPMGSRIIHICDVYDALISDRPYRTAWDKESVIEYLIENAGSMFHRDLVCVFTEFLV